MPHFSEECPRFSCRPWGGAVTGGVASTLVIFLFECAAAAMLAGSGPAMTAPHVQGSGSIVDGTGEEMRVLPRAAFCSQSSSLDGHTCAMALDRNMSSHSRTSRPLLGGTEWFLVDLDEQVRITGVRLWIPHATTGTTAVAIPASPFILSFFNSSHSAQNALTEPSSSTSANTPYAKYNATNGSPQAVTLAQSDVWGRNTVRINSSFESNVFIQKQSTAQVLLVQRKSSLAFAEVEIFAHLSL